MVALAVSDEVTCTVGSAMLRNHPSLSALGWMLRVGDKMRFPVALHAASICSCVARVPERRKRERGVAAAASLAMSDVAEAVASETMLETALGISETTGTTSARSEEVGAASVAVRLSIADARLSTTEGSTAASVGRVALPMVSADGKVPLRPVGAASDEMHVDATTGTVSTV
jgi:hypothetical protein